jgi:hypothetical protein
VGRYCAFCNEVLSGRDIESRTGSKMCERCLDDVNQRKVILFTDQGKYILRFIEAIDERIRPLQAFCSEHLFRTLCRACDMKQSDKGLFYRAAKSDSHASYISNMQDISAVNEDAATYL